jgi:membrane associated rhomboid family serine protease
MLIPIGDDQIKGGHYPTFSYGFILLNIAVFVYEYLIFPDSIYHITITYGAIPAEIVQGQDLYTTITSMFLHGGPMHLIGNMLFLWIFADNIEATIGSRRFVFFYLLGGLAALAGHIYFNTYSNIPLVGASGAIAAVMGAYLVMYPQSKVKVLFIVFPFRVPAFIFLGIWIAMQWMDGTASLNAGGEGAGIAYWAHIGGFVFGVLAGFYYRSYLRHARGELEA